MEVNLLVLKSGCIRTTMARSLRRLRKFLVRILEPQRHEERRAAEPQPTTSALKTGPRNIPTLYSQGRGRRGSRRGTQRRESRRRQHKSSRLESRLDDCSAKGELRFVFLCALRVFAVDRDVPYLVAARLLCAIRGLDVLLTA